jgi:Zn-dependent protease with chaperone function
VCISLLLLLLIMPSPKANAQQPQGSRYSASSVFIPPEFRPHVSADAVSYQRKGRTLSLVRMGWSLLGLWLFLQSGAASKLRDLIEKNLRIRNTNLEDPPGFVPLALYIVILSLLLWVWSLPFDIAGLLLERRYGFGTQSISGLLGDGLIAQAFGLLTVPLIWAAYRVHARYNRTWWLWIWAVMAPLLYVVIVLQPIVFSPMFNSYTPMPNSPLKSDILAVADLAGVRTATVLIENTSKRTRHVNAYVTGLGPSARIVINDTAIRELPEDQLLAMIGHELGHYVEHHIMVGYISSLLGLGVFLWLCSIAFPLITLQRSRWGSRGINDIAMLPALMLFVSLFLLVQAPIENAISRTLEHRADAFGLRLTHLNTATARLMMGFAERDYSDPDPPAILHFWFGSHPTLNERIAFALSYRQRP